MVEVRSTYRGGSSSRLRAARLAARGAALASRALRRGSGRAIGGKVALRVMPGLVAELAQGRDVLLLSATNGKSTTTALLTAAIRAGGRATTNADGGNTPGGLAVTLMQSEDPTVVLETDEAWVPWAVTQTHPATVVLLNLSRDQLHRNPEIRSIALVWRNAMPDVPVVVANVDDPHIVWAAQGAPRQVWVSAGQSWQRDSVVCPECGDLLQRDGERWWSACGLARPEPEWTLTQDGRLERGADSWPLHVPIPGQVNLGNAAMAVAAAADRGVPVEAAVAAVADVREIAGRYSTVAFRGHEVRMLLAKNPSGWNETVTMLGDRDTTVVLAFNSEGVDGRDPSWLYDVDFTPLRGSQVLVYGRRATDLLVRLLMEEVPAERADSLEAALTRARSRSVDLIANYSAFQEARKVVGHDG